MLPSDLYWTKVLHDFIVQALKPSLGLSRTKLRDLSTLFCFFASVLSVSQLRPKLLDCRIDTCCKFPNLSLMDVLAERRSGEYFHRIG